MTEPVHAPTHGIQLGRGKRELAKDNIQSERKKALGKGADDAVHYIPRIEKGRCARKS